MPFKIKRFKTACILFSRQAIRPSLKDKWIQKCISVIKWVKKNNFILLTSIGMNTWEIQLFLAKEYGLKQRIIIPAISKIEYKHICNELLVQFNLTADLTEFFPLYLSADVFKNKTYMIQRDTCIINESDCIIPLSIKNQGKIDTLLNEIDMSSKEIIRDFQIQYSPLSEKLNYKVFNSELNTKMLFNEHDYLIHWTKTANNHWPTEKLDSYYRAITSSYYYPRSAIETLKNILISGKIIGSSKNMPDNISTVSFTELSPVEIIPFFKWHSKNKQMYFEPYGIGIKKEIALKNNIRPVTYYNRNQINTVPKNVTWLYQSEGIKRDWTKEKEFRFKGDFNLRSILRTNLIIYCFNQEEANYFNRKFRIKTLSFY